MNIDLTDKELYLIEKLVDNQRDEFLKGIAQHIHLSLQKDVPKEYQQFIQKRTMHFLETWDMLNSISVKFEIERLKQ